MGAEPVEINDCEDGSILKDGKCVPMEGGDKECPEGLEMKDGECVMKGGNFLHAGKQITVGGGNMLYSNNYSKSSLLKMNTIGKIPVLRLYQKAWIPVLIGSALEMAAAA